jgi:hypothetical protein
MLRLSFRRLQRVGNTTDRTTAAHYPQRHRPSSSNININNANPPISNGRARELTNLAAPVDDTQAASSSPPPTAAEQQLVAAQLRITQLLCTPEVGSWVKVTSALQSTEREMQQLMSDFRYTQLSLSATHRALQEEVRECLAACAVKETTELRRAAGRAEAKEVLKKNVGFRARRVSEIAPPSHAVSRSLGARTPSTAAP